MSDEGALVISHYDAARNALAEARTLSEIKDIVDKAAAMGELARRAKDRTLELWSIELRENAERELGKRLAAMPKARGGRPPLTGPDGTPIRSGEVEKEPVATPPQGEILRPETLAEQGIDYKLSSHAQRLAKMPDEEVERRFEVRRAAAENTNTPLRSILLKSSEDRAKQRASKLENWTGAIEALPGITYGVILADPPWPWESYSKETGMDRAPDNHYATMTLETIQNIPIPALAAEPHCALFLWVTVPHARSGFDMLEAWDFEYKTQWVWGKDKIGLGNWNRNRHEILLLGTRGSPPCPGLNDPKWDSLQISPRAEHSRKPEWQYAMIDSYFPGVPKVELFARPRMKRDGWKFMGAEVSKDMN